MLAQLCNRYATKVFLGLKGQHFARAKTWAAAREHRTASFPRRLSSLRDSVWRKRDFGSWKAVQQARVSINKPFVQEQVKASDALNHMEAMVPYLHHLLEPEAEQAGTASAALLDFANEDV